MKTLVSAALCLSVLVGPIAPSVQAQDAPDDDVAVEDTLPSTDPASAPVIAPDPATAAPTPAVPATAVPAPAGDRGIVFGKLAVLRSGSSSVVAAPVVNNSEQVKSFLAKATFKQGDQIVATATGAVNDLLPGQIRSVSMLAQGPIPTYDSARLEVNTWTADRESTLGGNAAKQLKFGKPLVRSSGSNSVVDIEVTNTDSVPHSALVSADFYGGDDLVGVGSGAVNDLAPGQTKTATLLVTGKAQGDPRPFVGSVTK